LDFFVAAAAAAAAAVAGFGLLERRGIDAQCSSSSSALVFFRFFRLSQINAQFWLFKTKVCGFGVKSVFVFGCPAARWGALCAIFQGLICF
jgi:hypothetical protein